MPTYKDFEMLNGSLGRLGDSLLKNRMIEDQKSERATARGDRNREFETSRQDRAREFDATQRTQRERFGAQQAHWKKLEETAKLQANLKTVASQGAALKEGLSALGSQVRAGAVTNEEATAYVNAALAELPEEFQQQLKANPQFKAMADGKFDWKSVGAPKPTAQPAGVETDVYAAALEEKAAQETDPAVKSVLLERAKTLRSGIGRPDPTKFIEETEVLERDEEGKPIRTRRSKLPADRVNSQRQSSDTAAPAGGPAKPAQSAARANDLAKQVQADHPDWSPEKIKAEVSKALKGSQPPATADMDGIMPPAQVSAAAVEMPEGVRSPEEFVAASAPRNFRGGTAADRQAHEAVKKQKRIEDLTANLRAGVKGRAPGPGYLSQAQYAEAYKELQRLLAE